MMGYRNSIISFIVVVGLSVSVAVPVVGQRKITPVKPSAAASANSVPEPEKKEIDPKANLVEAKDAEGNVIFIDTISGTEWIDTTASKTSKKMIYPLLESVTVGLNLWDPAMRLFGQKYGGVDVWAELSLHNRYKPVIEFGMASCDFTPDGQNYTFKSPLAPFFRIGMNYNIFYNNDPRYELLVGVRYGFTPFKYEISRFALEDGYWGENEMLNIPSQNTTAGFFEFLAGVRVMIWKGISLGWMVKYHALLHEGEAPYGKPMYIPGYGKRNGAFSGSFSISYTLPLNKKRDPEVDIPQGGDS